jgi:hypothetical protein
VRALTVSPPDWKLREAVERELEQLRRR